MVSKDKIFILVIFLFKWRLKKVKKVEEEVVLNI